MPDWESPRHPFPGGGYESYYLKAHHPSEQRAIWLRKTVHQEPDVLPQGQAWLTSFTSAGVYQLREESPLPEGPQDLQSGKLSEASWEVSWTTNEAPLTYLPYDRLYEGGFPRTKPVSLAPRAKFSGEVRLPHSTLSLDGWEGMVGHNWGHEHAHEWVWAHALLEGTGWLDLVMAKVKVGPFTLPWSVNGAVSIEGQRTQLGGLYNRKTQVSASDQGATIQVPHARGQIEIQIEADPTTTAKWNYHDPGGATHDVVNCSLAQAVVKMGSRQFQVAKVAYEHGTVPAP